MIGDAIALYELVRRVYDDRKIISALFDWEGNRIKGDKRVSVIRHSSADDNGIWWYSFEAIEDFQFIRIPVNVGGVIESLGTVGDDANPDANYFRYIPVPEGTIRGGGILNVKVSFMAFAYRPDDLLAAGKA